MKKLMLLVPIVIVMSLLLSACGAGSQQPPATEEVAAETKKSGSIVYSFPADAVQTIMRPEQLEVFAAANPEIEVELLAVPEEGYDEKNISMIAAGDKLDVFGSGDVFVAPFIENGIAYKLTDLIANDPEFKIEDFAPAILDYFKDSKGDIYMLPGAYDVQRIYYNKNLFDAAGIAYPEDDWTWDEFKSIAEALTKGDGVEKEFGFLADTPWYVFMPYVWANGGNLWSEDGTKCVLNQKEAVEALDWYADFMRKGYSPSPSQLSGMGMSVGDMFTTGKVAMVSSGGWDIPYFNEITSFEWGQVALPAGPNGRATTLHLAMNLISAKTQDPELAWEWLRFIASSDMYKYEALKYGQGVPPRMSTTEEILAKPPADADPQSLRNFEIGLQSAEFGRTLPKIVNFSEIMDNIVGPNMDLFWNGEFATAQEVADLICSQMVPQPLSH